MIKEIVNQRRIVIKNENKNRNKIQSHLKTLYSLKSVNHTFLRPFSLNFWEAIFSHKFVLLERVLDEKHIFKIQTQIYVINNIIYNDFSFFQRTKKTFQQIVSDMF